jgi:hypothetical protein
VSVALWASDAWRAEAVGWLDERLAEADIARTGEVEQTHLRPWATVLRAPTTRGAVWLKAAGRDTAFEAGLYELLHRVAPDRVLTPLAVDTTRAWVLLPDGGPSLGECLKGDRLMAALEQVLPEYGALQRELAVAPGAPSLDHNDLHPWNILPGDRHARFYDWGDSVVAHPFASMLVALGVTRSLVDEPDVTRLRDGYLEGFTDLAPRRDLERTLQLACRVAKIARALTWHRAIGAGGPDEVEERWVRAPIESLFDLLE